MNPIGRDGRVSACMICRSIYHYAKECPNNASNKNSDTTGGNKSSDVQFTLGGDHTSSDVKFTLFCGYTRSKLQVLTEECDGYAILDSGYFNTVCGDE